MLAKVEAAGGMNKNLSGNCDEMMEAELTKLRVTNSWGLQS